MPEISRFFGIRIFMFYRDHSPPHFHARYGGESAVVEIASLRVLAGALPSRALGLVIEWAAEHRAELTTDWDLARDSRPLLPVEPLR